MVDTLYASTTPETAPRYEYYTVDISTNEILAQIPFEDVSYERKLKDYGAFEGAITITEQTRDFDLYNSTLPGKTALYVLRNGVCVWGGIIWGRSYDLVARAMSVSAAEFTSYFAHRNIWKSYSYKFEAELVKTEKSGPVIVNINNRVLKKPLDLVDSSGEATKVYITFTEADSTKYTGYYSLTSDQDPTQISFTVRIPKLPALSGAYTGVTVSARVDTYDYVRELIKDVLVDFKDTEFANEIIAPGIKIANIISQVSAASNTVTITTKDKHSLVDGQVVEIYNVNKSICGKYSVSEVLSPYQFKYQIPILKATSASRTDNEATLVVDTTDGVLVPFTIGQTVVVDISDNTYDTATAIITDVTHESITYTNTGSNSASASVTGNITVADIAPVAVSSGSSKVYSRQVVTSSKKSITHVKREDGYVWVTTRALHGFKKNDKVIVSFDTAAEEGRYKSLNNDGIPVIVLDATNSNTFKYYQSTKTANKDDIKNSGGRRVSVANPKKHTAVLATPISQLRLNTVDAHSYKEGDLIRVRGVDRPDWSRKIYDGYHKIVEVDTAQSASGSDVLTSTNYQIVSNNTATIWTDRNHGILPGDYVTISGFLAPVTYLNGKFTVTDSEDPDTVLSGVANFDIQLSTDRTPGIKTASTAGKIAPYGSSYLIYDMPEYGPVSEPDNVISIIRRKFKNKGNFATIQTDRRHNIVAGDTVKVDSKGVGFDGKYTVRSAGSDTFTYKVPRTTQGVPTAGVPWTNSSGSVTRVVTKVGGIPTLETPINRVLVRSNTAVIYSAGHELQVNDPITIEFSSGYSALQNGGNVTTVTASDDDYFEYTVSPGTADVGTTTISSAVYNNSNKVVTVTTTTNHGYLEGQRVYIQGLGNDKWNGVWTIKNVPDALPNIFTYFNMTLSKTSVTTVPAGSQAQSSLAVASGVGYASLNYRNLAVSQKITKISSSSSVVTVTAADHGYDVGDYVFTYIDGSAYKNFRNGNEEVQITSATDNTFTYTANPSYPTGTLGETTVTGYTSAAPQIDQEPVALSRTYGEFSSNSNMGTLGFSNEEYSNLQYPNDTIRGGDLISVAEHLDRYTNTRDGFDYRIDCSLVEGQDNKKIFKRTFTFVSRRPESYTDYLESQPGGKISPGTYPPASALGADKIVFEYPGNIQNVNFSENASESATRVFVGGNNSDLGGDASSRYSGAAATDLLQAGWPLLDRVEKVEWPLVGINQINIDDWGNYDSEADLQKTAERYLKESKPPTGDIIITVNGSLSPEIGTYNPGEWCSLLVDDEFVKQRMSSILEPRKDVIIRRIDGIKVQVPNSPAFPEMIDLELVTEWQVDEIGQ